MHERRALFRGRTPRRRQHPLRNMTQLDQILPVSGILASIFTPGQSLLRRIVQPRPDPAGKMKRSSHTDRSDGIQLVRIINQPVGQRLRLILAAVTVTAHRIGDLPDQSLIRTAAATEKIRRFPEPSLRMANPAARPQLLRTRHIVQQRRKRHRKKRSFI